MHIKYGQLQKKRKRKIENRIQIIFFCSQCRWSYSICISVARAMTWSHDLKIILCVYTYYVPHITSIDLNCKLLCYHFINKHNAIQCNSMQCCTYSLISPFLFSLSRSVPTILSIAFNSIGKVSYSKLKLKPNSKPKSLSDKIGWKISFYKTPLVWDKIEMHTVNSFI